MRSTHEWHDGTGYPDGLRGEQIPLVSRIVAVADAYDAMTSEHPYRDAITSETALAEIRRCSGSQFDPVVAEAFLQAMAERLISAQGGERSPVPIAV